MGMHILIAHGGGPTAVINTSLQGVLETAKACGKVDKIYAARFGVEGILKDDLMDLTDTAPDLIALLSLTPASAIGSCRRKLTQNDYPAILETLKKYRIDCFFYNGGNDSMDTCMQISRLAQQEKLPLQVIGIPKTMDNDLAVTDHCPGFGSAARYAAECACELALDASALPIHVIVLELMGRNAGWVTAASALASRLTHCEVLTCLPEQPFSETGFLSAVEASWAKGKGLLVAVSEGICGPDGKPLASTGIVDGFGHPVPGGAGQAVAEKISANLSLNTRAEKPGLLGRTSMAYASRTDREEAYAVGQYAMEAALRGESDFMVAIEAHRNTVYSFTLFQAPLTAVANVEKKFPAHWILDDYRIHEAFFHYATPLMMDTLPQYALLR